MEGKGGDEMLEIIYAGGRISNPIQLANSGKNKVTVVDMEFITGQGNVLNLKDVNPYVSFTSNSFTLEAGEKLHGMIRLSKNFDIKDLTMVILYIIGDKKYECQKKLI